MTVDELIEFFSRDAVGREHAQFKNISKDRRLSGRPDLHAFLLLDRLVPSTHDIVGSAAHDEIFLSVGIEALSKVADREDLLDLARCGVRYHSEYGCLAMFA